MWPIVQRDKKNLFSIARVPVAIGVRVVVSEMMKVWKPFGRWALVENQDCRSWGTGTSGVVQPSSWE